MRRRTAPQRPLRAILFALAVALTLTAAHGSRADAATYNVRGCDIGFQWLTHVSIFHPTGSNCGANVLSARAHGNMSAPDGAAGTWTLNTPADTSIANFTASFQGSGNGSTSTAPMARACVWGQGGAGQCDRYFILGEGGGGLGVSPWGHPQEKGWSGDAYAIQFGLICFFGNCQTNGWGAGIDMFDPRITLNDHHGPWAAEFTVHGAGSWQRGTIYTSYGTGDRGSGVENVQLWSEGGRHHYTNTHQCHRGNGGYTQLVPCPLSVGGWLQVDSTELSDGAHSLNVYTVDAAGQGHWGLGGDKTVYVDNHAPAKVSNPSVDGGDDWKTNATRTLRWANPGGQHAPIVRAHYQLCPVGGGSCTTGSRDGAWIDNLNLTAPAQGEYRARVWLEDQAGNLTAANQSDPVMLRYDNVPPGQARPERANGWLNAAEAKDLPQVIHMEGGAFEPVSGIRGYSVTTDGSTPDNTIEAFGKEAEYRINDLPEGVNVVRAKAISGAGVPSNTIGSTDVRVDKSAPAASLAGAPDPGQWARHVVTLQVSGTDQPHLSGMVPAPETALADEGAYIAYRIDGGPEQKVRGDRASVQVAQDGRHSLTYQAVDLAGNRSDEKTIQFKSDRTAPQPLAFELPSVNDPRRLVAIAADATSGIAGGEIEIRRFGADQWRTLATDHDGQGRLTTYLDDNLPDGAYQLRVRVRDNAGNEGIGDQRRDGGPMILNLPVRANSRVTVELADGRKSPGLKITSAQIRGAKLSVTGRAAAAVSGSVRVSYTATVGRSKRTTRGTAKLARGRFKITLRLRRGLADAQKGRVAARYAGNAQFGTQVVSRAARRPAAKRAAAAKRRKPKRKSSTSLPTNTVQLTYGSSHPVSGTVTNDSGQPLPSVPLSVSRQPRSGGPAEQLRPTATDADGRFTYTLPAGPSSTIRFVFEGNNTTKPSHTEVHTLVPAKLTFRSNKRRALNGQSVVFSGRLAGQPIPTAGKVVVLQARVGGKWRNFATPRASTDGRFSYRYQFTSTTGLRRYRIRASVPREAGYPYEDGVSKTIRVTVRGR